jgi:hypothetical protein
MVYLAIPMVLIRVEKGSISHVRHILHLDLRFSLSPRLCLFVCLGREQQKSEKIIVLALCEILHSNGKVTRVDGIRPM